jgi:hypothetical protein
LQYDSSCNRSPEQVFEKIQPADGTTREFNLKPFDPMTRILQILTSIILVCTVMVAVTSCKDDEDPGSTKTGTITGVVTDASTQPLAGVTVTVSGVNEEDLTATTESDGSYTITGVSLKLHAVTFSKTGYLAVSKPVSVSDFDDESLATVNASMVSATARIIGTVTDSKNGGAPLQGATVSVGAVGTATTEANGSYAIENLVEGDYTVTFTKTDYVTITKPITQADFVGGVATINLSMGGLELLRGKTADDLATADKWYYNEYRGGRNADAYPHWDWACDYMCTLDFQGAWDEQNEGTTLQIRNGEDDRANPADLNVFDSYVYGSKKITADNKILSIRLRTHDADGTNPAYFGVQVVDLSAAEPAAVKIGDTKTYGSGDYTDIEFDLSAYVGKEVIVAIGIYRQQTGDYWKQLVLRAIRFAGTKVSNWDWLPGTEVVAGWKLTQETVRSTMPQLKDSFTGISPQSGNRDNYKDAYRAWHSVGHIGAEWSFVPLKKDPEVFPSEGYLIKTNGSSGINTTVPESYMYAKFSIAAGNNQLTFTTRNFGSNYTFFKISAIEDNGTVTHLTPISNTAQEASAGADGTWKFKHGNGGAADPDGYAGFVYDLSAYNGQDVTLVIGVYKGEANGDENKLVFHTIKLN